jgi:hypothetical protein
MAGATKEMASATKEYSRLAQQTLAEMQTTRIEDAAPYPVVYFDIPFGQAIVFLVVKNLGKTTAENISFEFEPPLKSTFGWSDNLSFVMDGIQSLVPGQELRGMFDHYMSYDRSHTVPRSYRVAVTYSGPYTPHREITHSLSLETFKGTGSLTQSDMEQLVDRVREVTEAIGRTNTIIGEWARAAQGTRRRPQADDQASGFARARRLAHAAVAVADDAPATLSQVHDDAFVEEPVQQDLSGDEDILVCDEDDPE